MRGYRDGPRSSWRNCWADNQFHPRRPAQPSHSFASIGYRSASPSSCCLASGSEGRSWRTRWGFRVRSSECGVRNGRPPASACSDSSPGCAWQQTRPKSRVTPIDGSLRNSPPPPCAWLRLPVRVWAARPPADPVDALAKELATDIQRSADAPQLIQALDQWTRPSVATAASGFLGDDDPVAHLLTRTAQRIRSASGGMSRRGFLEGLLRGAAATTVSFVLPPPGVEGLKQLEASRQPGTNVIAEVIRLLGDTWEAVKKASGGKIVPDAPYDKLSDPRARLGGRELASRRLNVLWAIGFNNEMASRSLHGPAYSSRELRRIASRLAGYRAEVVSMVRYVPTLSSEVAQAIDRLPGDAAQGALEALQDHNPTVMRRLTGEFADQRTAAQNRLTQVAQALQAQDREVKRLREQEATLQTQVPWSPTGTARGTLDDAPSGATSPPPLRLSTAYGPTAKGRGPMAGSDATPTEPGVVEARQQALARVQQQLEAGTAQMARLTKEQAALTAQIGNLATVAAELEQQLQQLQGVEAILRSAPATDPSGGLWFIRPAYRPWAWVVETAVSFGVAVLSVFSLHHLLPEHALGLEGLAWWLAPVTFWAGHRLFNPTALKDPAVDELLFLKQLVAAFGMSLTLLHAPWEAFLFFLGPWMAGLALAHRELNATRAFADHAFADQWMEQWQRSIRRGRPSLVLSSLRASSHEGRPWVIRDRAARRKEE